ncbi:MAG: peptidylprolyl isomerase, partial [Blastocatellia bacterium]
RANLLADLYANLLSERNKISPEEKAKYIAANPSADIDKLRTRAQSLLDRVKSGESFEKIADENNDDGTRGSGGDLSWVQKGMMDPDFEKVAFALSNGEVSSELIRTRFGFHIIRVDGRRPLKPAVNSSATPAPTPTPDGASSAGDEVRVRHIFVLTQEADTFERRLVDEKVKRAIEDATLKYETISPPDFTVQVAGFNPNSSKRRPGGGNSGPMRADNPVKR